MSICRLARLSSRDLDVSAPTAYQMPRTDQFLDTPPSAAGWNSRHGSSADPFCSRSQAQSLQQKFMSDNGRGSAAAASSPRVTYLPPQRYMDPEALTAALSGGYPGVAHASVARQASPPTSSPRYHAKAAAAVRWRWISALSPFHG